ncbi:MAG: hypothetical protein PHP37_00160 [Patescibacteria group bacterium]|nr:hypothetical protein [Patescibacteria group bacterium]
MKKESVYRQLGVDPQKDNVKAIFKKIIDSEYPDAFVNIITDPYNPDKVITQHQDGDGSKFIQRLLHYRETGDEAIFDGMVDDALSMNTGDIAASGFVFGHWLITDVLNVNLPSEIKELVMKRIALRFMELKALYSENGFQISFLGGETADLRDQVKSAVFDMAITAWEEKENIISGNVQPGDIIFGLQSNGQAIWEESENSGLMSNGLTMARSVLMSSRYNREYPDLRRDNPSFYKGSYNLRTIHGLEMSRAILSPTRQWAIVIKKIIVALKNANVLHMLHGIRRRDDPSFYKGSYNLRTIHGLEMSRAILSPTRQWAIVIKKIIVALKNANALHMLHGISMNTGGGATKIKNLGKGIIYIKHMPTPPKIFQLIQEKSQDDWKNMYEAFNCGIGIDVVGENHPFFIKAVEEVALECRIQNYLLGFCRENSSNDNKVILHTDHGSFIF